MNRIARRTVITALLALILTGGMVVFLYEYITSAAKWAVFQGNPHIYSGVNIDCGTITDAEGNVLLSMTDGRTYSSDPVLKESTLHWVGDRYGYVSAPAVASHTEDLVGYSLWNGLYSYSGNLGGTAALTLYGSIQKAAMEALGDYNGTVGVYNYKTGEILCAVTKPSYDPDNVPDFEEDETGSFDGIFVNRFVQSTYTPGSIFKIATTAAALENLQDIEDYRFYCNGYYEVGADVVTCEAYHGEQSLKEAMCNSCNCAYAQLAELLGDRVLTESISRYRLTEPVRFDGITTAGGNFDISRAEQVQVDWSAIGQYTDLINPCRYMVFMGAIAGGGKAAVPYVVKDITAGGRRTYRAQKTETERMLEEAAAEKLTEYMRNNVVNNYGDYYFPGLTVCAKSGTSQSDNGQASNAMFAGFVTDEKYPLAFVIVVEQGGYGGMVCPPIMGRILEECKSCLDR